MGLYGEKVGEAARRKVGKRSEKFREVDDDDDDDVAVIVVYISHDV